ncbi:MAG: hypothetical protein R3E21_03645 [Caenibius sp.]
MRSRTLTNSIIGGCLLGFAMMAMPLPAQAQVWTEWSEKQQARRLEQFARLTPEHFARTSKIEDDGLEVVATIHTRDGYTFKGGLTDRMRADTFLRAFVDKRSGSATYQLYAQLSYSGEWRTFSSALYATSQGPVSVPLTVIDRDVDCHYGTCVFTEHVTFPLPEEIVRELAGQADEHTVKPWRFRFKARSGLDWTDDMTPAEAAGLLLAVERYRAAKIGDE